MAVYDDEDIKNKNRGIYTGGDKAMSDGSAGGRGKEYLRQVKRQEISPANQDKAGIGGGGAEDEANKLRMMSGASGSSEAGKKAAAEASKQNTRLRDKMRSLYGPPSGSLARAAGLGGTDHEPGKKKDGEAGEGEDDEEKEEENNTLFNPHDRAQRSNIGLLLGAAGKSPQGRRKAMLAAGAAGGVVALFVVIFLMLIPLKLENIVQNLQKRFFATSENAIDKESENLLSSYIKKSVLPALNKCPGSTRKVIDKSCNPRFGASANPVNALYTGWQQARLETKLADNYGLEFKTVGRGANAKYYIKVPGDGSGTGNGEEISHAIANDGGDLFKEVDFKEADRATVRRMASEAFEHETKWKQVMYRYKVGRLLEEKYGIKRCITKLGCKLTDKATDTLAKPKKAFEAYVAERVLYPRSQMLGTVFSCLFIENCDQKENTQTCTEGESCEESGTPKSDEDKEVQGTIDKLVAKFAGDDAAKIAADINKSGGITNYIVAQIMEKVFGQAAGEATSKALPVLGWIDLAAKIDGKLKNIGTDVKRLTYITNSASMVQMYMMYRTYADEIHSGNVQADEVGSFNDALGPNAHADKGGTGGAETSPLYHQVITGNSGGDASQSASIFGVTYADAASDKAQNIETGADPGQDLCGNGKPPTKLICDAESLNGGNAIASGVSAVLKSPWFLSLNVAVAVWNHTGHYILKLISYVAGTLIRSVGTVAEHALELVPGYNSVKSHIDKIAADIMRAMVNVLIPNPFSAAMSGARVFDLMAGGADVSGNDAAHVQDGGKKLTPAEHAEIVNDQMSNDQADFRNQPFFARMFSTDTPYSLVSRIAMNIPSGNLASIQGVMQSFTNPIKSLGSIFSDAFGSHPAFAAATAQEDPFGVVQYGYTDADIAAIGDPAKYWDDHCSDNPSNAYQKTNDWNSAAANNLDSGTEQPVNTQTNPCLLIKTTTGVSGGMFDTSLLTQDDLSDINQ